MITSFTIKISAPVFTVACLQELKMDLDWAARAGVGMRLEGYNDRVFSIGGDLGHILSVDRAGLQEYASLYLDVCRAAITLPGRTTAIVGNRLILAGGAEAAMCCDMVEGQIPDGWDVERKQGHFPFIEAGFRQPPETRAAKGFYRHGGIEDHTERWVDTVWDLIQDPKKRRRIAAAARIQENAW